MDYWEECISESFDDAGISATKEQIEIVASWVEGAHDNYSMAHGYDAIPNHLEAENDKLQKQLIKEKEKIPCEECNGVGSITTYGPYHSATSQCWKCHGEGRHDPCI